MTITQPPPKIIGDLTRGNLVVFIGDSITILNGGTTFFGGDSYATLASLLSGGRLRQLDNVGVSGNTTAQMLARFATDVVAKRPGWVVILGGSNDCFQAVPLATAMANLRAMANMARAAKIIPVFCTIPPADGAGYHFGIAHVNGAIRRLANDFGAHLIDFYSVLIDPANGGYRSGYAVDGVHPIGKTGGRKMADVVVSTLVPELPMIPPYLALYGADSINLLLNGVFVGDANVDGVADNWTLAGSGGAQTPSLVTGDTTIVGNWQQVVVATANGRSLQQTVSTGFSAGDTLEFSGLITTSIEAGAMVPNVRLDFNFGANGSTGPLYLISSDITRGVMFRRFVVPAAVTSIRVTLFFDNGSGTGTVKFAQIALTNATALGVV